MSGRDSPEHPSTDMVQDTSSLLNTNEPPRNGNGTLSGEHPRLSSPEDASALSIVLQSDVCTHRDTAPFPIDINLDWSEHAAHTPETKYRLCSRIRNVPEKALCT